MPLKNIAISWWLSKNATLWEVKHFQGLGMNEKIFMLKKEKIIG